MGRNSGIHSHGTRMVGVFTATLYIFEIIFFPSVLMLFKSVPGQDSTTKLPPTLNLLVPIYAALIASCRRKENNGLGQGLAQTA